jgi:hypothetical protein
MKGVETMPMKIGSRAGKWIVPLFLVATAACRPDEPRLDVPPDTLPPIGTAQPQPAEPGAVDAQTRQQHADALDQAVVQMREHILRMRALSPREAQPHMGTHAQQVESLAATVQQEVRALGAELDPRRMEDLMGLRPDHRRVLDDQLQTARAEAQEFRAATEEQLRERLPGHLDRLEQALGTIETSAAHLRRGV